MGLEILSEELNVVDLGITNDVTVHLKIKMFDDFSCFTTFSTVSNEEKLN